MGAADAERFLDGLVIGEHQHDVGTDGPEDH
jgi:hypothetical protein